MRTLLVVPTIGYPSRNPTFLSNTDFPTGLAYVAGALKAAGHEVVGLNPNNAPGYPSAPAMVRDRLTTALRTSSPEVVGFGGLCTDFVFLRDAFGIVRDAAPGVPIVLGGGIVTHDPEFVFGALRPDFCVRGEGEEVLVALLARLGAGRADLDDLPNLGYWRDGQPRFTREDYAYPSLDARAFPDYEPFGIDELLNEYGLTARYLYRFSRTHPRAMTIVTARSCPFKCTFCVHRAGPRYRVRSVANVLAELEQLHARYRFNLLIVLDELFAVNRAWFRDFCAALRARREAGAWDFDWLFQTHARAALTLDDLTLARAAGCIYFSYGVESGSPAVLASMNKRSRPDQIVAASALARQASLGFGGNLIFGDPAETPETIIESLELLLEHCLDDHINLGPVRPYPGSALYEECLRRGVITDRLQFYEHIDERDFNMTSMPEALWRWSIYATEYLGAVYPWDRVADASSCTAEPGGGGRYAAETGTALHRIEVTCPHCGAPVQYRELLPTAAARGSAAAALRLAAEVARSPVPLTAALRAVLPLVSRQRSFALLVQAFLMRGRLLPLLDRLRGRGGHAAAYSFVTGCPRCRRRLRVNLPRERLRAAGRRGAAA
jgi:anaerobic magnesium-protoporphyrin IX monomethyl ester cyclase